MDFTSDNTMDGNEDYTKVYVKTADGLKEFKASMNERKWGVPGFTFTDRVSYQHKVYEYAIPLHELGIGRRRPVYRAVSSILFSIFIATEIVTGCSGSSKEETQPLIERFTMTEADASDTNYLDGKLYTLSSTLDISVSGSYTCKCMFTDWNENASTDASTEERTVTIK